ncbi:MAG: hypothetical protein GY720_00975 [bacterium]|nr:hypothetical protein [bacterium]
MHQRLRIWLIAVAAALSLAAVPIVAFSAAGDLDAAEGTETLPAEAGDDEPRTRLDPVHRLDPAELATLVDGRAAPLEIVAVSADGVIQVSGTTDGLVFSTIDAPGRVEQALTQPAPRLIAGRAEYGLAEATAEGSIVSIELETGHRQTSADPLDDAVRFQHGVGAVARGEGMWIIAEQLEGEQLRFGVREGPDTVHWLDDGDLIPLIAHPEGGFLVTAGDGSLRVLDGSGAMTDPGLGLELPAAWSAAFSPDGLLALGLSTNQTVVVVPNKGYVLLDALPAGSPIDVMWNSTGNILIVNLSAETVNDSGVSVCTVRDGSCTKILRWSPDLRLAVPGR